MSPQMTMDIDSPLGILHLVSRDGKALTGLMFDADFSEHEVFDERPDLPVFSQVRNWLDAYFTGTEPHFTPCLAPEGTPFQHMIWGFLLTIPYRTLTTYGALAKRCTAETGRLMSAQAVGQAVGANPIPIIIPCHRVIAAGGKLGGYSAGSRENGQAENLELKKKLLKLEKAAWPFCGDKQ